MDFRSHPVIYKGMRKVYCCCIFSGILKGERINIIRISYIPEWCFCFRYGIGITDWKIDCIGCSSVPSSSNRLDHITGMHDHRTVIINDIVACIKSVLTAGKRILGYAVTLQNSYVRMLSLIADRCIFILDRYGLILIFNLYRNGITVDGKAVNTSGLDHAIGTEMQVVYYYLSVFPGRKVICNDIALMINQGSVCSVDILCSNYSEGRSGKLSYFIYEVCSVPACKNLTFLIDRDRAGLLFIRSLKGCCLSGCYNKRINCLIKNISFRCRYLSNIIGSCNQGIGFTCTVLAGRHLLHKSRASRIGIDTINRTCKLRSGRCIHFLKISVSD